MAFLYPFSRGQCPKGEPQLLKQGRHCMEEKLAPALPFRRPYLRKLSHVLAQRSKLYPTLHAFGHYLFRSCKMPAKRKTQSTASLFSAAVFFFSFTRVLSRRFSLSHWWCRGSSSCGTCNEFQVKIGCCSLTGRHHEN